MCGEGVVFYFYFYSEDNLIISAVTSSREKLAF